jgi:hypothetical protein
MKAILVVIILWCLPVKAQLILTEQRAYDEFIQLFPNRSYPFYLTFDYKSQTPYETPLPDIPQYLFQIYIFQQGFLLSKEKDSICFKGFMAKGRFPSKYDYNLVLLSIDLEAGCGEENYLVAYSMEGLIIDSLFVFGRGRLSNKSQRDIITFRQDASIHSDSIYIKRTETFGESVREGTMFKDKIKIYEVLYHISEKGRFVKRRETIKDDVKYWK